MGATADGRAATGGRATDDNRRACSRDKDVTVRWAWPPSTRTIVWSLDPAPLIPVVAYVYFYMRRFIAGAQGGRRARRRPAPGRLRDRRRLLVLLIALVSPIDRLGEDYLFSMHMVQHILIGDIAPLLVLLSLSRVIMRPLTRRLHGRRARARAARPPGDRDRRLDLLHLPLAHPGDVRRGAQPLGRPRAGARLLLRRRDRRLVAADPAGADAPPADRAVGVRLHPRRRSSAWARWASR